MTLTLRHALAAAILLIPAASLAQTSPATMPAPAATPPAATVPAASARVVPALSHTDAMRIDQRIKQLHDRLGITSGEQPQWDQFTEVMRGNAAAMAQAANDRGAKLGSMDALGTMQSYADLAKLHGENMEKLSGAFTALYASFNPAQKQKADLVFRSQAETRAAARAAR